METDQDKYLILHMPGSSGLDHIFAAVKSAIREAIYLKRVLVIDKYTMSAHHNLGHELKNLDIERYINLNKTQIYKMENNGSIEEINSAFRHIRMENFDHHKYPEELVLRLSDITPVSETQNNQYKVIVRKTIDTFYYRKVYPDILMVALYPSDQVEHLTDMVLRAMGTSLADAKKLSAVYRGIDFSVNKDTMQDKVQNNPLNYACLHARGNDMIVHASHKQAASSSHIRHIIKKKIPKGMRIYIMTDITKFGYLSFLEKDYTVYRYYDFLELKNLVSGGKGLVDNAMLYSVEKNIMQHAHVQLFRENGTARVIHTNCIYKIRWRYQILSMIEHLLLSETLQHYKAKIKRLVGR